MATGPAWALVPHGTPPAPEPSEAAQRGLKLLSAQNRKLHPRGQVRSLHRIATRAISSADWQLHLAAESNGAWPADQEKVAQLRRKASDAVHAMLHLNHVHKLGYPVPTSMKEGS